MATHSQLCDAAVRWLYGTMRCNVALSGIASAREIPDAIGWSTSCRAHGSIVVEAKVSLSDFHRNKAKRHGCKLGNYRYFLVPDGLVTAEQVSEHYPNHGLLHLRRGRCSVIQRALRMEQPDLDQEVRLLQFALLHVNENLLGVGCAVDMNTLTKAYMTNRAKHGWHSHSQFGFGIELPSSDISLCIGEHR